MDIEAIVKKYGCGFYAMEDVIRNALTELAAGYEERLAPLKMELERIAEQLNDPRENLTHSTAQCIASLQERIRQLESEQVPELPQEARDAIHALGRLFEQDCRVVFNVIEIPAGNHDQAFNWLVEAREIIKRASPLLAAASAQQKKEPRHD